MKKILAFVTLGAAAYFGSHFPLLNTGDDGISIYKNYFTGSYTVDMPGEGLQMVFDKRHEDTINALCKVASLVKDLNSSNEAKKELNDTFTQALTSKMKP